MSGDFIYGRCERYNCTMSTEFCEKYRRLPSYVAFDHNGRNNSKCAGCGGLTMYLNEEKKYWPRLIHHRSPKLRLLKIQPQK